LVTSCVGNVTEGKTEGRIDMMEKRGGRHQQLLDYLKAMEGYRKLKGEALDHTLWRTYFGKGYGPI
jgi:hypothetical protein